MWCCVPDAKWFTRDEILAVLDYKEGQGAPEPSIKLPPRNALAGVLVSDWAHGRIVVGGDGQGPVRAHHGAGGDAKPFKNFF